MWIFHKLSEIWGCSEKKRKISKKAEVVPITEKISKKGTNSGTYGQPRLNPREKKTQTNFFIQEQEINEQIVLKLNSLNVWKIYLFGMTFFSHAIRAFVWQTIGTVLIYHICTSTFSAGHRETGTVVHIQFIASNLKLRLQVCVTTEDSVRHISN